MEENIEKNLEDLLNEWIFIGKIQKGNKPCFSDKTVIDSNAWFVTWRRRIKGEQGEKRDYLYRKFNKKY
jgi:hypothetical protein